MKPPWKIARLFGITVYVHGSFPLLIAWIALEEYLLTGRLVGVPSALLLVLILFGFIVLHELGHALTARLYGIRTRDITLLPIGGIARLERMPINARQELLISIAGPAVNVACAAILLPFSTPLSSLATADLPRASAGLLTQLVWINLALASFNLLPAFPLDGGRVFRALLALRFPRETATAIATNVGRLFALSLGFVGLLGNPLLLLLAVFIWFAGGEELRNARVTAWLTGVRVDQVLSEECRSFAPNDTLARATNYLLATGQSVFPIVDDSGRIRGIIEREKLIAGLDHLGPDAPFAELMDTDVTLAQGNDLLTEVLERWPAEQSALPVVREGKLAGLLTRTNLGEFLLVQRALRHEAIPLNALPT